MEDIVSLAPWRTWVILGPLGFTLAVAAFTDARDRKIPNRLTYPAFGVGLVAHGLAFGLSGFGWGFLTALAILVVGFVLMIFGLMGGGDVKLLTVCGAFLGFAGFGELLFYSVFSGFFLGLAYAAWNGALGDMIARMARFLVGAVRSAIYMTTQVAEPLESEESTEVPFAIAILAGAGLALTDALYNWPGIIEFLVEM